MIFRGGGELGGGWWGFYADTASCGIVKDGSELYWPFLRDCCCKRWPQETVQRPQYLQTPPGAPVKQCNIHFTTYFSMSASNTPVQFRAKQHLNTMESLTCSNLSLINTINVALQTVLKSICQDRQITSLGSPTSHIQPATSAQRCQLQPLGHQHHHKSDSLTNNCWEPL